MLNVKDDSSIEYVTRLNLLFCSQSYWKHESAINSQKRENQQKRKQQGITYRYAVVFEQAYYKRGANEFEKAHFLQNGLDNRRKSTIARDMFLISNRQWFTLPSCLYFIIFI